MNKKNCYVNIDASKFEFQVEGDFFWGKEELLYEKEHSVISKTDWESLGYACVKVIEENEFDNLKHSIYTNIIKALKLNNIKFNEDTFTLSNYHKIVHNDALHLKVIDITRNLTNGDFNFDINALAERFGKILGYKFTSWIEELKKTHVQIRINRPNSLDINPPHRDGYLSYWKDIINVWIPIEGCNEQTSLPVCPGSHLIKESDIFRTKSKGAKINGNTYYVPCILKTKQGMLNMVRPNPKQGEALIFTPFLIHGAAINNSDVTRVSLELRFPRVHE
ncbi:phytanoyl-CoA dioxygenase family protein [Pontimicrobium aquaticum]|uniref:Phytanoyl-CoA dioxygenase n=1 Tax=Pontimicrobium aquaticum TaxID=2565367 RepID=A0A4U0EWU2_9FLAO|nr:phytanoyl-CoA dioxygenase family protein [Pontimicrobium aquaticum]TJY36403.1 phytanoyl-CoA dioxygenase [Pontimicrobium aquaticum]